jgi:hypothetical protein
VILRNNLNKECYIQEEKGRSIALEILKSNVEKIMKKYCPPATHSNVGADKVRQAIII